jgi:di/tricarboxylate transporter
MVYGPGKYRFFDFFKVGLPLTLLIFLLSILLVPRIWPPLPSG